MLVFQPKKSFFWPVRSKLFHCLKIHKKSEFVFDSPTTLICVCQGHIQSILQISRHFIFWAKKVSQGVPLAVCIKFHSKINICKFDWNWFCRLVSLLSLFGELFLCILFSFPPEKSYFWPVPQKLFHFFENSYKINYCFDSPTILA